jgi:predicted N-formylglutamate amidohydrolase
MKIGAIVVSCEHGGNHVPARYEPLFASAAARRALASHRGYDIGALPVARLIAQRLGSKLYAATVTRLLVDLNRSLHHHALFSEYSAVLDADMRRRTLERYYWPHRQRVIDAIRAQGGKLICHVGVHSFAPVRDGVRHRADVGLLYDPRRAGERAFCRQWQKRLALRAPELIARRNYPYRGAADGLTTALRRRFPAARYLGIELETNQALLTGSRAVARETAELLAASLAETLGA